MEKKLLNPSLRNPQPKKLEILEYRLFVKNEQLARKWKKIFTEEICLGDFPGTQCTEVG